MEQRKLKEIINDLEKVLDDLKSEVYSDPSKYLQDIGSNVKIGDDNDGEAD
jgi:hypothetical protein